MFAQPQSLHNPNATVSSVSYGSDKTTVALFEDEYIKNEAKSAVEGRLVLDHHVCVTIVYPGNNTTTFKRTFPIEEGKAGNQWTERFPNQWQAFLKQAEQLPDGTPVEEWPVLNKKRVLELKAMNFFTVEQIANVNDRDGEKIGLDWRKLRDQANAFLKPDEMSATVNKLASENESLRARLEAMEKQVADIGERAETETRRRGRPPSV